MKVMTNYKFFDEDVESVVWEGADNVREISLSGNNEGALLISRDDVIALAAEFGLVVYRKDSCLSRGK